MFAEFLTDESGAITVDWVVLTAALVGLGLAVIILISVAAQEPTNALNSTINGTIISTSF